MCKISSASLLLLLLPKIYVMVVWVRVEDCWVYTHKDEILMYGETYSLLSLLWQNWYRAISEHRKNLFSVRLSTFMSLLFGHLVHQLSFYSLLHSEQSGERPEPRATLGLLALFTHLCWLYDIPDIHSNPICHISYQHVARGHAFF